MHERQVALKSKLLPLCCVLGALSFATPAAASPAAPPDDDGVVNIFGFEVCLGEQPGVDCELTLPKPPVDRAGATKREQAQNTAKSPRKLELLGMTMCVGGTAADCDIALPWRSA